MSVFSDAGKTISSVFRATRKAAETAEILADESGKAVANSGRLINGALSNAAEMGELEQQLEMDQFKIEHQKRLQEFRRVSGKAQAKAA